MSNNAITMIPAQNMREILGGYHCWNLWATKSYLFFSTDEKLKFRKGLQVENRSNDHPHDTKFFK